MQLQWLPPVGGAWIGCSWATFSHLDRGEQRSHPKTELPQTLYSRSHADKETGISKVDRLHSQLRRWSDHISDFLTANWQPTSGDLSRKIWEHSGEKCWYETAMYLCRMLIACCSSWEAA